MDDDNAKQHNIKVNPPHTLYRGVYRRVAAQLGVDPSYVSRVARGERISSEIQQTLTAELDRIATLNRPPNGLAHQDGHLNGQASNNRLASQVPPQDGHATPDGTAKIDMPKKNGRVVQQANGKIRRPPAK